MLYFLLLAAASSLYRTWCKKESNTWDFGVLTLWKHAGNQRNHGVLGEKCERKQTLINKKGDICERCRLRSTVWI